MLEQEFFTLTTTTIILISIALSIFFANLLGVPQSTSQSTVLSIAGAAAALGGLNTNKLFLEILPTWIILPFIAFVLMLVFTKYLYPTMRKKIFTDSYAHLQEHKGLKVLLILASCYVAFSIGANNVANAAAPIASLTANELGNVAAQDFAPIIILSMLLVAPCFAIGSSLLGHKVTEKTGKEIVEINPFNATIISFLVATLLLGASLNKGIPTSLVQ